MPLKVSGVIHGVHRSGGGGKAEGAGIRQPLGSPCDTPGISANQGPRALISPVSSTATVYPSISAGICLRSSGVFLTMKTLMHG